MPKSQPESRFWSMEVEIAMRRSWKDDIVMKKDTIFGDDWMEEMEVFTNSIFTAVARHVPRLEGHEDYEKLRPDEKPWGVVLGNMSRLHSHPFPQGFFDVSDFIGNNIEKIQLQDEIQDKAVYSLISSLFDFDVRVGNMKGVLEAVQKMIAERGTLTSTQKDAGNTIYEYQYQPQGILGTYHFPFKVRLSEFKLKIGLEFVIVELVGEKETDKYLSIAIAKVQRPEELATDFRYGSLHCQRANSEAMTDTFLAYDKGKQEKPHYLCQEMSKFSKKHDDFRDKERIESFDYKNLQQALVAGLRMIHLLELWPPDRPGEPSPEAAKDYIEAATIKGYRQALKRTATKFLAGEEELDNYRVEEIIREGILGSGLDPNVFLKLAGALGILEVFAASKTKDVSPLKKESQTDFEFRQEYRIKLKSGKMEDFGSVQVAKALGAGNNFAAAVNLFDLRRLKKD